MTITLHRLLMPTLLVIGTGLWLQAQDHQSGANWVDQSEMTPRFRFRTNLISGEEGSYSVNEIEIIDRTSGAVKQAIRNIKGDPFLFPPSEVVKIVDANFDGVPDFAFLNSSGGAGPNSGQAFYLFNRQTGKFELHKGLTELTQVSINRDRTISSSFRDGCCDHTTTKYRYNKGRLVEVESWRVKLSNDGHWAIHIHGVRRNGKMSYKTSKIRANDG